MEVMNVEIKEIGTAAKKKPSTTAGLTSGYQRTNITTSGVSVAETTGGYMVAELVTLPWYEPLPFAEPYVEIRPDSKAPSHEELTEGYRSMAAENSLFAEECLPIAREMWPSWGE